MSDTRFTLLGIALIFAGFITLGIFGAGFRMANIQNNEFGDCYKFSQDAAPIPTNCSFMLFDQTLFFMLVIALIGVGIAFLIKGVRGKWDQQVKPEDMVGPGHDKNIDDSKKD